MSTCSPTNEVQFTEEDGGDEAAENQLKALLVSEVDYGQ